MGRSRRTISLFLLLLGGFAVKGIAYSRTPQQEQQDPKQQEEQGAKQAAKAQKRKDKDLFNELDSQYKKWLNEDVVYIITPEERNAFIHLSTNEEREQFIEQFWQRRNPDPDSPENTFKEEHYRRIAYTNEHYASGIPGWKTDRGRIYIMWGKPDEVDSHPTGGTYERPSGEGGGETSTYPFEDWRYRYLEGIGENVELEFVDPTSTGEYHLTMDPSEKDALLRIPGAGLTMMEQMGMSSKTARFTNTDGTHNGKAMGMQPESMEEFTRLELYAKIQQAPPVKFKDLEAVVTSRLVRDQVKFEYRFDFLRITSDTVLVPITVQISRRQMTFQEKDGVDSSTVNLFARITSLSGRIVQTIEDTLRTDIPASLLQQSLSGSSIYQKAVPLSPGLYRLDIVLKDLNSNNVGVVNTRLAVPRFQDDQLSSSSLILADEIQRVSMKDIGLGQFVLGDVKVRPRLDQAFLSSDNMGVFLQVYNLKVDDKTHKPDASVEYRVKKLSDPAPSGSSATGSETPPVLKFNLSSDKLPEHGEELTLENMITLGSLAPGKYKLEVAVTDNLTKQTITPTTDFTVKPLAARATQGR
ncbi:MAG TPA: GWxTD domain-containing protein [Verrucomicrobiae bacterium]|jgi:GWxTD domain-containing protein|nr:GWxTD domain-containing protein [Verrucomicrobiae bacterium]